MRAWRLRNMKKVLYVFDRFEEVVLVVMFAAMVLAIFFQVIMRYVFNNSLPWSEELGKFLFVWLSWFGISIGAKRGEHIKITMLTDKLSYTAAQICNILSEIVVIGICAVTLYYGVILVSSQSHVRYAGIKISISWGYLAVAVGCGMMIARCVLTVISSLIALKDGKGKPAAAPEGGGR